MTREECERALAFLEKYSNRKVYGCVEWNDSTSEELRKALTFIDRLIVEYFELVEHIDLIASCLEDRFEVTE